MKELVICRRTSYAPPCDQRGFTLLELIIASAVTGILIIVIMSFMTNQIVENAMLNARSAMLREAQIALDIVNSDIRHAASVDDVNRWADAHAPGADEYGWEPGEEVLILATPAKDAESGFLYDDPFAYITHKNNLIYFLHEGTLYRRTLAADIENNSARTSCPNATNGCTPDMELINDVSDFTVRYFDANDEEVVPDEARSVAVTIRIERIVYGRDVTAEYTVRSVFRNV